MMNWSQLGPDANRALEMTGSDYRVPGDYSSGFEQTPQPQQVPEWAQQASGAADMAGSAPGLANSPVMGLAKKVVGAVAAFYTGGLSGLAMNVGGQVLAKNNPQAAGNVSKATTIAGMF